MRVVAALRALAESGHCPDDFYNIGDLLRAWKVKFPFVNRKRINDAVARGWVRSVRIPADPDGKRSSDYMWVFVHVAPEVMRSEDPDVVRRWLWEGGVPPERAQGWT
jgi:hypothetical protein